MTPARFAESPEKPATPDDALMVAVPPKVFDPFGVIAIAVEQDESENAARAMLAVEFMTVFPSPSRTVTTGCEERVDPAFVVPEGLVVNTRVVAAPA